MIKSMTGFGNVISDKDEYTIKVEVKSLNSKFLDISVRLPRRFSSKEMEVRNLGSKRLVRGKVSISVDFNSKDSDSDISINKSLFKRYYEELKELAQSVDADKTDLFKLALSSPEVMGSKNDVEKDDQTWEKVEEAIVEGLERCDNFRSDEGEKLRLKLKDDIESIRNLLYEVLEQDPKRIEGVRERIEKGLSALVEKEKVDNNRLEQELIYYIEKLDINEEKVRLHSHLDYFIEILNIGGTQGKKLGFVAQEIGREINTIGSKANDAHIQKSVVGMKEELEKIKEQLLNIL